MNNIQPDSPDAPRAETSAPKTVEHVAPAPHIWEDWQTDILEKYLPDYRLKKSTGARVAIMGKVLQKFNGKMESGDGDAANIRKVNVFPNG